MERFKSKDVKDREEILYNLFGNGKASVGIRIVKTIKDIEKEGKKPIIREMMRRGLSPTSLEKYIPRLTDLGVIIECYPDPTRKYPQYKVNSDYDWIIDLIGSDSKQA